ncbi:MAG: glycosyltransferase family 2 protein [Proteobacteria bacterium]|nr:MAG: glycosyltransferase family 2 protein [Pseudomonadota bacterium]
MVQSVLKGKAALPDLSVVVTIRIDSPDRVRNLTLILGFLSRFFEDIEIVVVEQADEPGVKDLVSAIPGSVYVYFRDPTCFYKSRNLNHGASISTRKFILILDADVFLAPRALVVAHDKLRRGDAKFVYPYNGVMLQVRNERIAGRCELDGEFIESLGFVDIRTSESPHETGIERLYGAWDWPGVGGALMVERRAFFGCGGYNPNIFSYGVEDGELDYRMRKLAGSPLRLEAYNCYHLEHRRGVDSRYNNFANSNRAEFDRVRSMSAHDLRRYVDNGFRSVDLDTRKVLSIRNEPGGFAINLSEPVNQALDSVAFIFAVHARCDADLVALGDLLSALEDSFAGYESVLIENDGLSLSQFYLNPGTIYLQEHGKPGEHWLRRVLAHTDRETLVFLDPALPMQPRAVIRQIEACDGEDSFTPIEDANQNPRLVIGRRALVRCLEPNDAVAHERASNDACLCVLQWLELGECDSSSE